MPLTEKDPVRLLSGVGPKRAALYEKLGVHTIGDLLLYVPRGYLDFSAPLPIAASHTGENVVVRAKVYKKQGEQRIRKGLSIFRVYATDESTDLKITIYNAKYLFESLKEGVWYLFYGKVTGSLLHSEMSAPQVFPEQEAGGLLPLYSLTEGLSNRQVTENVREALRVWGDCLLDALPPLLRRENELCQLRYAVENVHFPTDSHALGVARYRLIFEELLILQLGMTMLKNRNREETSVQLQKTELMPFLSSLPFTLTNGQTRAIDDCIRDMQRTEPMNRLVQGDVGSGKTMVAAALCFLCRENGLQAAVMAPTQILAEQHYETFSCQLAPLGVRCCLLDGSQSAKQRAATVESIHAGEYTVVIGTHALLQEDVRFQKLGLVVTDEQHRFGVGQRAALAEKGDHPHLLVMSATPIPRTLALLIYGDLDVSVIRELPSGRKPVRTMAVGSDKRLRALGFIKKQIDAGRQAYIVCPLIEDNESELVSAQEYVKKLKNTPLAECSSAILHGRMKAKEKETLMRAFRDGEISLLIATTVVEVGVDVPNATVMMIENAERFGLSQLHQLRGRVGRGAYASYCILVSDHKGEENRRRLHTMVTMQNGFDVAQEDLKLRGPGDFFGKRQHGLPDLRVADLLADMKTLEAARKAAERLLTADPELSLPEHCALCEKVQRLFSQNGQITFN